MCTQSDRYRGCLAEPRILAAIFLVVIIAASLAEAGKTAKVDYCERGELCFPGTRHVACNGYKFGANCTRPILIKMTPKYINLILNYHNTKRNDLACGSMRRYASASSMQKLHWNDELAHLAEYNAKSCHFAHDECHNTDKFRYTGQSIGMKWFYGMNYTATHIVRDLLRKWYVEHKLAKQRDVDQFVFNQQSYKIGHFTQLIHADTTEIGCALVRFMKRHNNMQFPNYYLVCNYSEGNIENRPVYRKGKRCSKCKHGCTRGKFPCLCRA